MCDNIQKAFVPYEGLTRRRFTALAASAGAIGVTAPAFAQGAVSERDVVITTQDGRCDAVFFHPSGAGAWPGVLVWPDAGGLRASKRDMGRRLAAQTTGAPSDPAAMRKIDDDLEEEYKQSLY